MFGHKSPHQFLSYDFLWKVSYPRAAGFICIFSAVAFALLSWPASAPSDEKAVEPSDPTALVQEVVQNEIYAQLHDNSLWCFREQREEDSKAPKTLEVCGTKDGDLERLVAVNGRELSSAEIQAQDQHISKLIGHPAQLRAKKKKDEEDAEQVRTLLRDFPQAFYFQYISANGNSVRLRFWPNSAYRPTTRAETVFHHLEGNLVIDWQQKRIAEINGRITSEVKFFGGLLGHLDPGGTFLVTSGEVAPGHWDTTLMNLDLSGKAIFFKTISVHQREVYADYTAVPTGATLREIAELLKKECSIVNTALRR